MLCHTCKENSILQQWGMHLRKGDCVILSIQLVELITITV
jgi:hypothetical protein